MRIDIFEYAKDALAVVALVAAVYLMLAGGLVL